MNHEVTTAIDLRVFELSMLFNRLCRTLAIQASATGSDSTWQEALRSAILDEKMLMLEVLQDHRKRLSEFGAPDSVIEDNAADIACVQATIAAIKSEPSADYLNELRAMILDLTTSFAASNRNIVNIDCDQRRRMLAR